MRAAGYDVKVLAEEFGRGTPDREWLPTAIEKGWVLIGKDDRWRYRPEEKEILIRAKARAFIFVSKSAKREEIAEAVIRALPRMALLVTTQPAPFIGRILLSGYVGLIYPPA
jgi:PIN like domain